MSDHGWPDANRPNVPLHPERDGEEWRPVAGYEGFYEVSSLGRIRTIGGGKARTHGRILKPTLTTTGYERVALSAANVSRTMKVHQMVAAAFIGARPAGAYVLHNDGNPLNNRMENLRYGNARDNLADAVKHGTWAPRRGEAASKAKLTVDDVLTIRGASETTAVLAARYGLDPTSIRDIKARRSWAHV
jgi:hypothetical protein